MPVCAALEPAYSEAQRPTNPHPQHATNYRALSTTYDAAEPNAVGTAHTPPLLAAHAGTD